MNEHTRRAILFLITNYVALTLILSLIYVGVVFIGCFILWEWGALIPLLTGRISLIVFRAILFISLLCVVLGLWVARRDF